MSFPPADLQGVHQRVDTHRHVSLRLVGELGVQGGGLGTFVAHLMLDGTQVEAGFHQVGPVTVAAMSLET